MKRNHLVLLALIFLTPLPLLADIYTVQPGDTLSKIAQAELGESARWKEIAELNDLQDPYTLSINQTLQMPADYQSAAAAPKKTASPSPEKSSLLKSLMLLFSFLSIPLAAAIGLGLLVKLISDLLFAAGYKAACRILKMERTLGKCFLASICLSIIGIFLTPFAPAPHHSSAFPSGQITNAGIAILICVIVSIVFIKFFLKCNWPQSLAVYIVGRLIGILWHLFILVLIGLPFWIYLIAQKPEIS